MNRSARSPRNGSAPGLCLRRVGGCEPRVSGYSMTQLIETSLISGHFANESNAAYLDIFSCKFYLPYVVATFARAFFGAQEVRVTATFRR